MRKYTLVIIDMQPHFGAAKNKILLSSIKLEIAKAIKLNNHIMFVRYIGCGKISSGLLKMIIHYNNVSFVNKDDQDGGHETLMALSVYNARTNLKFCGVNTDECVRDTITHIAMRYPKRFKIHVMENCCYSYSEASHKGGICALSKIENVYIKAA
ncbi:MAG: isochorismatase family protein [bacterium]|nr:isochorismatase family protein [bacterium]